MHGFNKMLSSFMNGEKLVDTNSEVGNFGNIDSSGVSSQEDQASEKLILYLDSGIEIHIPSCVFDEMMNAMNGGQEEAGEVPEKECPFSKEQESDENEDNESEDEGEEEKQEKKDEE